MLRLVRSLHGITFLKEAKSETASRNVELIGAFD